MKNLSLLLFISLFILSCKNSENQNNLAQLESDIDDLFNSHIQKDEPGAAVMVAKFGFKGSSLVELQKYKSSSSLNIFSFSLK